MKKTQIKAISIILIIIMCLTPTASAASISPDSINSSLYLAAYGADMYAEGGGEVSIWFDVTATGTMDEVGALTIILQQSTNGTTWSTVKTYSYTSYSNMLNYNDTECVSGVYYNGVSGRYYRAYVTVWAGIDGEGDSRQILASAIQA